MERETIIKALECCTSSNSVSDCMRGCPLYEKEDCECINDDTALLKYALALIKELIEENEVLTAELSRYTENLKPMAEQIKADTVREMQEKLKKIFERFITMVNSRGRWRVFYHRQGIIDRIAYEMLGKECPSWKHFVGCEPSTLGVCDMYEEDQKE